MGYMVVKKKINLPIEECKADVFALGVIMHNVLIKPSSDYINSKTI